MALMAEITAGLLDTSGPDRRGGSSDGDAETRPAFVDDENGFIMESDDMRDSEDGG